MKEILVRTLRQLLTSLKAETLTFHVPRLTHLAGLELGAGLHLNIVSPEHAAAELRHA